MMHPPNHVPLGVEDTVLLKWVTYLSIIYNLLKNLM